MQNQSHQAQWSFLRTLLLVWLFVAVFLARFGLLAGPQPRPQALLAISSVLFGLAAFRLGPVRDTLWNCDIRLLIALHLTRFVGFWFLILYEQKRLPYDFAVKGGWGDIVTASLAVLVLLIPAGATFRLKAIKLWNWFGLADILFVIATAIRLTLGDPHSLDELRFIPMSLLPTFLVPLIVVTHLVIWRRVARQAHS